MEIDIPIMDGEWTKVVTLRKSFYKCLYYKEIFLTQMKRVFKIYWS
jgi:hypothetical protein